VAFGLIAAAGFPHWLFATAVGLGFLFGTAFIGGTGYRIILGVIRVSMAPAPASWSGATAGSALYAVILWAILAGGGHDGVFVLLAYGVAINIAYLPVKLACLRVGCCRVAHGHVTPANIDLRKLEAGLTIGVLAATAAIAPLGAGAGAITAIGGHLGVRAMSRHLRNRGSWGWPPLRQPGSEIAPLALLLCLAAVAAF
jgi:hypothetical protein